MVGFRQKRLPENVFNLLAILGFLVFLIHLIISLLIFAEKGLSSNHEISFFQDSLWTDDVGPTKGFVLHQWKYLCEMTTLKNLFQSSLFPKYPDHKDISCQSLFHYSPNKSIGARLSGFLNVPESGYYAFQLKSIGMAEFWLKMNENKGLERIARSKVIAQDPQNSDKVFSTDLSTKIFIENDQAYKFEIFNAGEFVQLHWITPGTNHFSEIKNRFISHDTSSFSHEVPAGLFPKEKEDFENENRVGVYYFVSFIPKWVIDSAIPGCDFALTKKEKIITKLDSVNVVTLYDDLNGKKGNLWNQNTEVNTVVSLYMDGLERVYPLKYRTKRLYKMEKIVNTESQRPLYKMQLEFKVDGLDYTQRVIQYVHQLNSTAICQPIHLRWHRDALINILIVLKEREKVIKRFIDRFEKVFEKTLEVDIHLIIVQFGQSAIDIKNHLGKTSLVERYSVNHLEGPYSRSRGLNEGASLAKVDHAIVLTFDVNIDIPDTMFEDIRTTCIPGQMAFSPVLYQLDCGQDPSRANPRGYWCYQNYGVIGIYKTDWDRILGMEPRHSEQKENWDLIQKIRKSGMTVIRHTYPGLYRYHTPYKEHKKYGTKTPMLIKDGFLARDDQ